MHPNERGINIACVCMMFFGGEAVNVLIVKLIENILHDTFYDDVIFFHFRDILSAESFDLK